MLLPVNDFNSTPAPWSATLTLMAHWFVEPGGGFPVFGST